MGSVKFTVRAGEITDLGTQMLSGGMEPAHHGTAVDARLKDWPLHPADYRAVGKLPNYYGVKLDRINAIPGVISYRRDQIIDPQQKSAVASAGSM